MALPPKPPRPANFMAALGEPAPSQIVVAPARRVRGRTLEAWMIPVAVAPLAEGMPLSYAAEAIGKTRQTVEKWIADGLDEACTDELLIEFAAQCVEARSKGRKSNWRQIKDHAVDDPKSALEIARAADRDTWTERKELKVEVGKEPETAVDLSLMSDAELEQYAQALAFIKSLPLKTLPSGP